MKNLLLIIATMVSVLGYTQDNLPRFADSSDQIVQHAGYILSYNEGCEQPNWVRYEISKFELDNDKAQRKDNFAIDTLVQTGSANPKDYAGSGYDRGHLAPAAVFVHDQGEMDESFLMSNISPQIASFNRGIWKKAENWERKMAEQFDSVTVISGAVLSDSLKTINGTDICVPEYYYKIVYIGSNTYYFIFKHEKSSEPLNSFLFEEEDFIEVTGLIPHSYEY
jgi:endonuclease G